MPRLRLATIGAWGHFSQVFEEIATTPDLVDVVGLAKALPDDDLNVYRRFAIAQKAPAFNDYGQMLREQKPDVVVVSTRLDRINPIAVDAARAGCHLICEKPLALDGESLQKLYQTTQAHGVQCIAMLNNPSHPVIRAARQLRLDGRLGKVALVNARKSYKWGDRPIWFGQRETYGSTIGWVGIHALDMIHAVTGERFTSLAAMHSNLIHTERPACQDNAALILSLSGGGHATVSVDLLRPDAAPTHGDDWLRIVGSGGVAEASLDRGELWFTATNEPRQLVPLLKSPGYYTPFLQQLASEPRQATPDTIRAFELTDWCLSALEAAEKSATVDLLPRRFHDRSLSGLSVKTV